MGSGGAIDINLMALIWIMDKQGVAESEQLHFSRKVRYFNGLVLEAISKSVKDK